MNPFLANVLLAVIWALLTGMVSIFGLIVGYAFGFAALYLAKPMLGDTRYFARFGNGLAFVPFLLWELLVANWRTARDVLTPRLRATPAIVAVPLDARTDTEITLLANVISLLPGTLSLDVSADRRTLYVHSMFTEDPEQTRDEIKSSFERRLLKVLR